MFILKPKLIAGGMLSAIFAFGMVHTATGGHGSDGNIKPGYQKELGYDDHSGTSDFKHPIYGYMFDHPVFGYKFKHPVYGYMPISARGMNYGKFEHPMYGSVFKHPVYGYKFKHPKLGFIPINMESHDYDIQSQDEAAHTEGG